MNITLNHHLTVKHESDDVLRNALSSLTRGMTIMTKALDRLTASVTAMATVEASTVSLLSTLSDEIRQANTDDSPEINAIADKIDAMKDELGTAVAANTPAAPTPADPAAPADPAPVDPTSADPAPETDVDG
jgi:hypothetical protein